MTMFDEMGIPIHLPIGDLNAPVHPKEMIPDMKPHYHHDEESQYMQRISMPMSR